MINQIKKGRLYTDAITIGILALFIFILILFTNHPKLIEQYYSQGFYLFVCSVLHPIVNLIPFSMGDLLYLFIVCYLLYALVLLIKLLFKKEFKRAGISLLKIIIGIETTIVIFYLFWGLNYFRPSAAERLNLKDSTYTTASLKSVTIMLIDSANACRARVTSADLLQSNKTIYQTAVKAINSLSAGSANFHTYSPGIKSSLLTPLLNYITTSGYYNPFTTEAQINYEMPIFDRPFVACHEMAHQMGYGPEDEANFAGFIAGIHSKDRLLRYSAYRISVDEFMHALKRRDSTAQKELRKIVSPAVHNDFITERNYWVSYANRLGLLSSIFYDNFLKANNQPEGLHTYNRMVLLVMAWHNKTLAAAPIMSWSQKNIYLIRKK